MQTTRQGTACGVIEPVDRNVKIPAKLESKASARIVATISTIPFTARPPIRLAQFQAQLPLRNPVLVFVVTQ